MNGVQEELLWGYKRQHHCGDKLANVNWKSISKSGKDTVIPIVWTNNDKNIEIEVIKDNGNVEVGEPLFKIN